MRINHDTYTDDYIREILQEIKTIAVVGASANMTRPSNLVTNYLNSKNYDVIPVNPGQAGNEIAGCMTYASLSEVDRPINMIDIFRNSEAAYGVVVEALALDPLPQVIWMQLGVRNDEAAKLAEVKGINVVMNRCPKIEYDRLLKK